MKMMLPLILAIGLCLSACAGTGGAAIESTPAPVATTEPASIPSATAAPTAIAARETPAQADNTQTGIGMMVQEYYDDVLAEIPLITYDGQREDLAEFDYKHPEIEFINNEIESGPLRIYHAYMQGEIEGDSLEIRSYPFMLDEEFIQVVTTCVVYPETVPEQYTRAWSYNFSRTRDRAFTVGEMLAQYGLTQESLHDIFLALYESDVQEERVYSVQATGFLINRVPAAPVTHFLLEVMLETQSDPWKDFFVYTPENEELEELDAALLFDPYVWEMVTMDPPLAYEMGAGAE